MLTQIIKDPNNLGITTKVNGKTVQNSSTQDMIFNVKQIINFVSQGTTLLPGDVIMTGTPEGTPLTTLNTKPGVGMGRKPQLWLKHGDTVEVELENVGKCINKVVFENPTKSKL
jgi:2-keto-4-pentenoate hydratase/2-oxohepta-3-ene-1,7-dioic acid hydratase in catechol pathway